LEKENGEPMLGVNILELETNNGTQTDLDGNFTLTINSNSTLKFSFLGYISQEVKITEQTDLVIYLQEDSYQLDGVIVTAYGIEREKKAAGFAFSEINGDELNQAKEVTVAAQLTGKVAGLEVTQPNNGPSGATRIVIRGLSQFQGENRPLIVIDGIPVDNSNATTGGLYGGRDSGDGFSSLNPDDIENITVLKGPSASALYGSRAGNGVVLITTKKGAKSKGLKIEYSTNFTTEEVFLLPNYQEEYGQGANGEKPSSAQDAFENWESWGGKLDGSLVPIFNGEELPYSAVGQDDIRSYYQRGNTWQNNLSINGGNKKGFARLSLSQLKNNSIVPNTRYDRYTATLNGRFNVTDKIWVEGKASYAHEFADNRTNLTDNPSNPAKYFTIGPANIPQAVYQKTRDENGDPIYWSQNPFTLSPYWGPLENLNNDTKKRFIGYLTAKWEILEGLSLQGRIATDNGQQDYFNIDIDGTHYNQAGSVYLDSFTVEENNFDLILNYKKDFSDNFAMDFNAGTTRTNRYSRRANVIGTGYIEPGVSEISNMSTVVIQQPFISESRINALFATASFSFNNYLYLEGSVRNDFFSVLTNPRDVDGSENSILYASSSLSFVLSDAINSPDWLSFAKLRFGYGTSGFGQIEPYSQVIAYTIDTEPKILSDGEVTFGNISGGSFRNPFLKPSRTTSIETGFDMKFIDSRYGIDFTFYQQRTDKHIFPSPLPASTGYNSYRLNAGEVQNQGVELLLTSSLIRKKNFQWDARINFSKNVNKIISLTEDVTQLNLGVDRTFSANIVARKDGRVGDILGNVYARNDAGQIIHDEDGLPMIADEKQVLGNFNPDWFGGFSSTFTYKNLSLSFLIDTKQGGEILSTTSSFGYFYGRHINTLEGRGNPDFTMIGQGVGPDGMSPNSMPARVDDYYETVSTVSEENVYDASYIKFRQLTLSYNLKSEWLDKTKFINQATVSLVGRNLFFLQNGMDEIGLDPESIYTATGNDVGIEYAALPSTRSYGINLSLKF